MRADNHMIASLVADRLFENGFKQCAERLVLTSKGGKDLGGWCKGAVLDQVEDVLDKWNPQPKETPCSKNTP